MEIRIFYLCLSSTDNHRTILEVTAQIPVESKASFGVYLSAGLDRGAKGCHCFCLVRETSWMSLWVRGRGQKDLLGQGLLNISS